MKDAFYFSHDANAHDDPKMKRLIFDLKAEGYGIYWFVIELLRNEPELKLNKRDFDAIAYQMRSNSDTVAKVINDYELFEIAENGDFRSNSLCRRTEAFRVKSLKYRENALKRWNKDAIAEQSQSNGNALKVKDNKRKGKEFTPPSLDEVSSYCSERKNTVDANKFHAFYEANGWVQGRGKKINDWKAAVRYWENNNKEVVDVTRKYKDLN